MWAIFAKFLSIITTMLMVVEPFLGLPSTKKTDYSQVKNVIFMIGDGMGFNSIEKTRKEEGISVFNLDTFPLNGESQTRSTSSDVTDSAAGGTALACAIRTTNGNVGVYPYEGTGLTMYPMNLTELAISQGKLAGVITSDKTSGATPAAFSAHTSSRDNEADITSQQFASQLTLVWGAKTASFTEEKATEYGFEYVHDKASMDALTEGTRSFAQFDDDVWHNCSYNGMPTLAEMTEKAIDLIDDDEDGFFLMVEGAHIDKNNHSNNGEGMKDALQSFDAAIGVALEYAKTHEGTLVVVTADHETGGITLKDGEYVYTRTGHSGANVPVRVYGSDDLIKDGEVLKNKELSRRVSCAMGCPNFPVKRFGMAVGKLPGVC